jgi:hypothetical protein
LQNELRSGLRELDQVKTELAVAASTQGMMGRTLGATTASANRNTNSRATATTSAATTATTTTTWQTKYRSASLPPATSSSAAATRIPSTTSTTTTISSQQQQQQQQQQYTLPPAIQTERAVMEDEWEKQGIGFRSRAEQMGTNNNNNNNNTSSSDNTKTGSELLEHLIKQNLIFDQYERVVGEQEAQMQERMESFQKEKGRKGETSSDDDDDSNDTKS